LRLPNYFIGVPISVPPRDWAVSKIRTLGVLAMFCGFVITLIGIFIVDRFLGLVVSVVGLLVMLGGIATVGHRDRGDFGRGE
jgi:hypothetical protein